jgi:hypothetical protein
LSQRGELHGLIEVKYRGIYSRAEFIDARQLAVLAARKRVGQPTGVSRIAFLNILKEDLTGEIPYNLTGTIPRVRPKGAGERHSWSSSAAPAGF